MKRSIKFRTIKNFRKNGEFEQSHSAEKFEKGTLWDFLPSILLQIIKKKQGGPFGDI